MSGARGFVRPSDDDFVSTWKEDRPDTDANRDTAFVFNSAPSLSIGAQRRRLPIAKNRLHLLYLMERHQVVVVVGETGSGKSTQIPQFIYEAGWCAKEGTMVSLLKQMGKSNGSLIALHYDKFMTIKKINFRLE